MSLGVGPRDVPVGERLRQPLVDEVADLGLQAPYAARPAAQPFLVLGELDEVVRRAAPLQLDVAADRAARVLQIGRLVRAPAVLAGVAILVLGPAHRALAADVPVGEEPVVDLAVHLLHVALLDGAVGAQRLVDAARVQLVLRRMRRIEEIEPDLERLVVLGVLALDPGDPLLGRDPRLARADLDRSPVRVVGADEDAFGPHGVHRPDEDVGLDGLDHVAEMEAAVGVRQRVGDEHAGSHQGCFIPALVERHKHRRQAAYGGRRYLAHTSRRSRSIDNRGSAPFFSSKSTSAQRISARLQNARGLRRARLYPSQATNGCGTFCFFADSSLSSAGNSFAWNSLYPSSRGPASAYRALSASALRTALATPPRNGSATAEAFALLRKSSPKSCSALAASPSPTASASAKNSSSRTGATTASTSSRVIWARSPAKSASFRSSEAISRRSSPSRSFSSSSASRASLFFRGPSSSATRGEMSSVSMVRPRRSARRRTCAPFSCARRTSACFGGSDSATRIRCVFGGRPRSTAWTRTSRSSGGAATFSACAQEDSSCSHPLSPSSGAAPMSLRHLAAEAPVFDPNATSAAAQPAGRTRCSNRRAASRCRLPCQRSRTRESSRGASTSSAKASAPSTTTAFGAANIATVTRCEAISRAPAAASTTTRFSARSFSGTIASASSRALVRARYSSPSISVTARAFPEVASSISSAMSATAQLPGAQQEPLELQPAIAVLTQRLDHVGAERRLSEQRTRRHTGGDFLRPARQLAQLRSCSRAADEQIARPGVDRLGHGQCGIAIAVRLGEIERLALVPGPEGVFHLTAHMPPFVFRLE